MDNKNKYIVNQIIKGVDKELILLEYVRETGDPHFDDTPSEQLQPGDIIYPVWNKEGKTDPEFNQKSKL